MNPGRRGPALAVVMALLVGAALLDRRARVSGEEGLVEVRAGSAMPRAAPGSALSSTWYCPGATAGPRGAADGSVVVANAGSRALSGTLTAVPVQGQPRRVSLSVGPWARTVVRLADVVSAPFAAALVELGGGDAVVELAVRGALGDSVAPCASAPSGRWYFADGSTTRDAAETLLVFNPFPEDAVVDFAFSTEDGRSVPQALTGLAVAGRSLRVVEVGEHVHRREAVSAEVRARVGRLVVGRLQTYDGSEGRKGLSLSLGAPGAFPAWYLPEGLVADGLVERYQIFNPSGTEARAEVALALEQGEAEPFELTVPPESRVTLTANDEARIPEGVGHSATVRVLDGEGLVVERAVDAGPPSPRLGVALTLGVPTTARRWALALGAGDASVEEWLVIQNPQAATARVSVSALVDGRREPVEGLQALTVAGGRRMAIRLGAHLRGAPAAAVVSSSRPVVVERDRYRVRGLGLSMVAAIPLSS